MKTRAIILRPAVVAVGAALAAPAFLPSTPALGDEGVVSVGTAPTLDPDTVQIDDVSAPTTYRFPVPVPEGGQLRALPGADSSDGRAQAILVEDAAGVVVGAYDQAWAQDAAGEYVPTRYHIEGTTLVQTVDLEAATSFPVVIDPMYSPVGSPPGPVLLFVGVPSDYVYNPALGSLHDYCTSAPDQFPNPVGSNADFRGPCARHDMCYEGGTTSEFTCDNRLYADMVENCEHEYAWYNPARGACVNTAAIYWAAVVVA